MKDFVVGRSEGIVYTNNNLLYKQFTKDNQLFKPKKKGEIHMDFINKMVEKIKDAKNDAEIKEVLSEVYFNTQYDSAIRAEFDNNF